MGRTGRRPLPIDHHFFDRAGKTPDELKALWYFLGISGGSYRVDLPSRRGDSCNAWCAPNREVVEIVKRCLKSEHTLSVQKTVYASWRLQIVSEGLAARLSTEYGLGGTRSEHDVPDELPSAYLAHYVRGLADAAGKCKVYTRAPGDTGTIPLRVDLRIRVSTSIKEGLWNVLLGKARISKTIAEYNTSSNHLVFTGESIHRIADYMYRDWAAIEQNGLYAHGKLDDIVHYARFPHPGKKQGIAVQTY